MTRFGLFHKDDASAVLPAAFASLTDLRNRGLAHRYVRHLRSSQAFALNLFAPLNNTGVRGVLARLGHEVTTVEPPRFEFEDMQDRLQEASVRSPHRTQVDVVLSGTSTEGRRIAALIEVKLSETNFGSCSAFHSPHLPNPEVCDQPGLFGSAKTQCFQLQNHGYGHRRYAEYLAHVAIEPPTPRADAGGCYVRDGRSQPMRNLALGHMLVQEGDYDEIVFALCAPTDYASIWRRFREFRNLFHDTSAVTVRELPAEIVAHHHTDSGATLAARYGRVLSDTALVHLTTDGAQIFGVWVHRSGHPEAHYGFGHDEGAPDYGEAVVSSEDWWALVDRLPRSTPHIAWWEAIPCGYDEDAKAVYERLSHDLESP